MRSQPPRTRTRSEAPPATDSPRPDAGDVVQIRAAGDAPELRDGRRVVWYPAVVNRYSLPITEDGKRFREVIRPGAFGRTLASGLNVRALIEHDPAREVASRETGLVLQEDPRGLFASFFVPETLEGDSLLALVRGGHFKGGSMGFVTVRDRWHDADPRSGLMLAEILELKLVEVTFTAKPAYPSTVLSTRSDAGRFRERRLRLLKLGG